MSAAVEEIGSDSGRNEKKDVEDYIMPTFRIAPSICIAIMLSLTVAAQQSVTTTGGTTNAVPIFTGSSSIGSSIITQSNGNVGIGTAPVNRFHVSADYNWTPCPSCDDSSAQLILSGASNSNQRLMIGYNTASNYSYIRSVLSGTSLEPLVLNPDGGNVGVGTTSPLAKLHVSGGEIRADAALVTGSSDTCGLGVVLPNGTNTGSQPWAIGGFPTATSDQWIIGRTGPCWTFANTGLNFIYHSPGNTAFDVLSLNSSGNVGIGAQNPSNKLEVNSGQPGLFWNGTNGYYNSIEGGNVVVRDKSTANDFWWVAMNPNSSSTPGIDFLGGNQTPAGARASFWSNVGIGVNHPGAKLEVNGSVKLTAGSGGGVVFPDATTQTTAWTGVLCGGDYAESVGVSGKRSQYEPGDVIVIDPANPENFLKSSQPYATTVAGIYSTRPGAIGRRSTDPDRVKSEIPMAMVGIVPTKVSAENGPIKVGDLLVTSSTAGYAMKGTDRSQMLGAVVGKALGSLNSERGVINVLVTLQ